MAKNGRAGAALATAAIGSFVAGTIATVLVTLFAPWVATHAVKLGPPEYFMLMVLAFVILGNALRDAIDGLQKPVKLVPFLLESLVGISG